MEELYPILSAIGTLILMLLVFYGAYRVSKLVGHRYQPSSGGSMKILQRQPLGKDRELILLQCAEKVYLLGVTDGSIRVLDEPDLSEDELVPSSPPSTKDFTSLLREACRKRCSDHPERKE